jgi:hypothetical protein
MVLAGLCVPTLCVGNDLSLFRADATFALQGDDAPSPLAPRAQNGNAILILQNDRQ